MEKLNISKGFWVVDSNLNIWCNGRTERVADCNFYSINDDENARLIVEAGNVANETGKTPRQLLEENKELLKALTELKAFFTNCGVTMGNPYEIVNNAIKKVTNE